MQSAHHVAEKSTSKGLSRPHLHGVYIPGREHSMQLAMLYKYHGCPCAKIDMALYPSPFRGIPGGGTVNREVHSFLSRQPVRYRHAF